MSTRRGASAARAACMLAPTTRCTSTSRREPPRSVTSARTASKRGLPRRARWCARPRPSSPAISTIRKARSRSCAGGGKLAARKTEAGTGPNVLYREVETAGIDPMQTTAAGGYLWSQRRPGTTVETDRFLETELERKAAARTVYNVGSKAVVGRVCLRLLVHQIALRRPFFERGGRGPDAARSLRQRRGGARLRARRAGCALPFADNRTPRRRSQAAGALPVRLDQGQLELLARARRGSSERVRRAPDRFFWRWGFSESISDPRAVSS